MIYEILLNDTKYLIEVDDTEARLKKKKLREEEEEFSFDIPDLELDDDDVGGEDIRTTMPGQVISIAVREGDPVRAGQTLLVLESMKMENPVCADRDCRILEIPVSVGQFVGNGGILFRISAE